MTGGYSGNMEAMTDDELLLHMSQPIHYFEDYVKRTVSLDMPYSQAMVDIGQIADATTLIYETDYPPIVQEHFSYSLDFLRKYTFSLKIEAEFALTQVAIELYDIVGQTGSLPEVLPDYLPKDPFTGTSFEYELVSGGFALRFQEIIIPGENKSYERVFVVPSLKVVDDDDDDNEGPGGR